MTASRLPVFTPADFALFWTIEPQRQDWLNLDASKVERVQLTYDLARHNPDIMVELGALGRSVVVRLSAENMRDEPPNEVARQFARWMDAGLPLTAAQAGNEIEYLARPPYDPRFETPLGGSTEWGQVLAYEARSRLRQLISAWALNDLITWPPFSAPDPTWRLPLVSAGNPALLIAPDQSPVPGLSAWLEIMRDVEADCYAHGGHLYAFNWHQVPTRWHDGRIVIVNVDKLNLKWSLQILATLKHRPLWIDEIGVLNADDALTQVGQMEAYIEFADWLLSAEQQIQGRLGTRVWHYCPFITLGDPGPPPHAWPPSYLITDPAAYRRLGEAMTHWRATWRPPRWALDLAGVTIDQF